MGDSITNLPLQPNGNTPAYSADELPIPEDPRLRKQRGATSSAEADGAADVYEAGGQPGLFPVGGQGGASSSDGVSAHGATGAEGGDGTGEVQDTGVQPGSGDMLQQLSQEYGPMGAMMMLLCSGGLGGGGGGLGVSGLGGGSDGGLNLGGLGGGGSPGGLDVSGLGGLGGDSSAAGGVSATDSVTDPDANPELMQDAQGTGDARNQQGGTGGVQYQSVSGSLWGGDGNGVTGATGSANGIADSIQQTGNVGDCYFLASLSGAAAQDPNAVKNMIRPDPNGNPHDYQVRFYAQDPQTHQMTAEWVSVNDQLPTDAKGQGGAAGLPKDASGKAILGPALIEKAFAKFNDEHQLTQSEGVQAGAGYNGIGNGGTGTEALEAITGKQSSTTGDPNATGSLADQGVADSDVAAALQQANPPQHAATIAGSVQNPSDGIVGGHEYTVLGTYQQGGQTMVTLRNPWGTNDPKNPNDPNQGVVSISLDQFKKDFSTVSAADGQGAGTDAQDTGNTGNTGGSASTGQMAAFSLRNQFMRA